jgi:glycosyltransferase involved in cell wall biosynthesis
MKALKILLLTHKYYPELGGIEVNSEILAEAFHQAGHEVRVLTWTKEVGDKTYPFPIIRVPSKLELFKQHNWADVVFENNPCLQLAWPAIFFRKASVIALNTWIDHNQGKLSLQSRVKKIWVKRADSVIAVSNTVKKQAWPAAIVIGNPYRVNLFKKLPGITRDRDFVFLGRLVSDKGADLAINALHMLQSHTFNNKSGNYNLTIIGDGAERESLEKLAFTLGLHDNVKFTGMLTGQNLVECLNKHKILLVPSLWSEPFGNVALEGMACGCLPIVSDDSGLIDAVGNAGLTFKRGDVNSLTNAIISVLVDEHKGHELQNNSTEHLLAHDPQKVSSKYLEVIIAAYEASKK